MIARMANGKCEPVRIAPLKCRSSKKRRHAPLVHMIRLTALAQRVRARRGPMTGSGYPAPFIVGERRITRSAVAPRPSAVDQFRW